MSTTTTKGILACMDCTPCNETEFFKSFLIILELAADKDEGEGCEE
jgi:hypothetical protein